MTENRWSSELLTQRVTTVRENIAEAARVSGRSAEDISLMAVTKTIPAEVVNLIYGCGIHLFGENRAQELCGRYDTYDFDASAIHFIGALQTNKVRQIIDKVSCIQSVDSLHLAKEIDKRACQVGKTMRVFLEVNIGAEPSKSGVLPEELPYLTEQAACLSNILVCGLMTIPPAMKNCDETRSYFDQMYKLFVDIKHKKIDNVTMEYLSMGMSADYQLAIQSGANLIRIGSGIFGSRT
ncbi:MAG: YggS family pyridoxal phosphate-dependent enzyme [Angelakisella sp.]